MSAELATYKRATRGHITQMQNNLGQTRLRAELAEKQVRDLIVDKDRWKRRAEEAEA